MECKKKSRNYNVILKQERKSLGNRSLVKTKSINKKTIHIFHQIHVDIKYF